MLLVELVPPSYVTSVEQSTKVIQFTVFIRGHLISAHVKVSGITLEGQNGRLALLFNQ